MYAIDQAYARLSSRCIIPYEHTLNPPPLPPLSYSNPLRLYEYPFSSSPRLTASQ